MMGSSCAPPVHEAGLELHASERSLTRSALWAAGPLSVEARAPSAPLLGSRGVGSLGPRVSLKPDGFETRRIRIFESQRTPCVHLTGNCSTVGCITCNKQADRYGITCTQLYIDSYRSMHICIYI